jgi:hypothetical protein
VRIEMSAAKNSDNYSTDKKRVVMKFDSRFIKESDRGWLAAITIFSFIIACILTVTLSYFSQRIDVIFSIAILIFIILINIIFDIVGIAVAAADEEPFHSIAARKIYGAKRAIWVVKNASKVSNFCNDVIGDICGVISGIFASYIVLVFVTNFEANEIVLGAIFFGLVTAFTVGGKAIGKDIAISNSNYIVYKFAEILNFITGK